MASSASESSPSFGSGLSAAQVESVLQLQETAGIDDLDVCRALLESNDWNLDDTIAEQQRGQDRGQQQPDQQEGLRQRRQFEEQGRFGSSRNGPNRRQRPQYQSASWFSYFSPWRLIARIYEWFLALAGFDVAITNNSSDAFIDWFNQNFPNSPLTQVMLRGTYKEALETARRELRFLLVYIHSPRHQDTAEFCRSILSSTNSPLVSVIEGHNLLLYCCSVESMEGQRVSLALREATYPFLGLVVQRQHRMMLVGRREGMEQMANLESDLQTMISDNEAFIVAARADREERERTQNLRAEQDAAFQETLRQDQERERLKREQQEEERRQREAAEQALLAEQEQKAERQRLRTEYATRVPEEPENNESCVRIVLKLPSGERLERRFLASQSIAGLYYFVFCHPSAPDEFEIWSHFPRRLIECEPNSDGSKQTTFADAGLNGSAVLFVNDLEE